MVVVSGDACLANLCARNRSRVALWMLVAAVRLLIVSGRNTAPTAAQ